MKYIKLFLVLSLVLLITHCNRDNQVTNEATETIETTETTETSETTEASDTSLQNTNVGEDAVPSQERKIDDKKTTLQNQNMSESAVPTQESKDDDRKTTLQNPAPAVKTGTHEIALQDEGVDDEMAPREIENIKTIHHNPILALRTAQCLAGVYVDVADVDGSFWGSFPLLSLGSDPYVKISMAYNSNNEKTDLIILIEELGSKVTKNKLFWEKPKSAVCTIMKDIQYAPSNSPAFDIKLFTRNLEHRGAVQSVFGIQGELLVHKYQHEFLTTSNKEDCTFSHLTLLERDGSVQDISMNTMLDWRHKNPENTPSYEELKQKCMALRLNELNRR